MNRDGDYKKRKRIWESGRNKSNVILPNNVGKLALRIYFTLLTAVTSGLALRTGLKLSGTKS